MNKVILIGRLVRDPEIKRVANGDYDICKFTIAVDRSFSSSNQDGRNTADFISIVAWRKQAENITKFQKKGNQIAVDGRLQVDNYTGKDGNTVWSTYVVADSIQFLDRKNDNVANNNFDNNSYDNVTPSDFSNESSSSDQGASVWDAGSNIEIDPDELPFY